MAKDYHVLECVTAGCVAEFYVNDIPIIRRGPALGKFFGGPIDEFLVPGENELAILVNPGPTPGRALAGQGARRRRHRIESSDGARCRLSRYPAGTQVGGPEGHQLAALKWQPPKSGAAVFPLVVSDKVNLGSMHGRWPWQDAQRLSLDTPTAKALADLLTELRNAFQKGSAEAFIAKTRHRLEDLTRAYGLPPGEREAQVRSVTREDSQKSHWGFAPLEPTDFDLRLCAKNRMLELIAKDWEAILRENPDSEDTVHFYPLLASKLGPDWQIVR